MGWFASLCIKNLNTSLDETSLGCTWAGYRTHLKKADSLSEWGPLSLFSIELLYRTHVENTDSHSEWRPPSVL